MKKVVLTVFILLLFFGSSYASFKDSLKQHLEKNNIEDGSTQIYLLNRCSAVYTYASAILLETDKLNSKNFIEISNNLLFKAIELMIIEEEEKKFENKSNKLDNNTQTENVQVNEENELIGDVQVDIKPSEKNQTLEKKNSSEEKKLNSNLKTNNDQITNELQNNFNWS